MLDEHPQKQNKRLINAKYISEHELFSCVFRSVLLNTVPKNESLNNFKPATSYMGSEELGS
jgi:hypothetical protein